MPYINDVPQRGWPLCYGVHYLRIVRYRGGTQMPALDEVASFVNYGIRGFRFLLALGPPGASARTSSCVIANHKIQYFLYFRGNASMLFRLKRAFGATNMAKLGHFWFRMLAVLLACAAPFQTIPLTADRYACATWDTWPTASLRSAHWTASPSHT